MTKSKLLCYQPGNSAFTVPGGTIYSNSQFCNLSLHNFTACAAQYPVEKAACKLKPPVIPCTSNTSPMKNTPFFNFDSMVFGSTSFTLTPPAVTMAVEIGKV